MLSAKQSCLILTLLSLWWCCQNTQGQSAPKPAEGRVLFIVSSSAAMEKYAKIDDDYLSRVVGTGGGGLLSSGDTFSLWRFNTNITSDFPLKRWTPASSADSATKLFAYLKATKYEKEASFKILAEPLNRIMTNSEKLWVVILSDGKNDIVGTPFDKEINAIYKAHYKELKSAKVPFVTILGVRHGTPKGFSVNSALAGLRLPYMAVETNSVVEAKATNTVPAKEVKKPETKPLTTNAVAISVATNGLPSKITATNAVSDRPSTNRTMGANFGGTGSTNFVVKSTTNAEVVAASKPTAIQVRTEPIPEKIPVVEPSKSPALIPAVTMAAGETSALEKQAEIRATNVPLQVEFTHTQDMAVVKSTQAKSTNDWSGPFVSPSKEMTAVQVGYDGGSNESLFFIVGGALAAVGLIAVWMLKRKQKLRTGQESLISATLKKK
ncbi:MAG: hypothetical protein JWN25_1217 [Verrucomicrobiales bacterium]|nr:hypothetical protein [Verrucomicrobiales bacterium]